MPLTRQWITGSAPPSSGMGTVFPLATQLDPPRHPKQFVVELTYDSVLETAGPVLREAQSLMDRRNELIHATQETWMRRSGFRY